MRPNTACPGSGLYLSGNIGTYSVGVGDKCVLYGPDDQACITGEQGGYRYTFSIVSGGSHGTLTPGVGTMATFKRTSTGDVVIDLKQEYQIPTDGCKPGGFTTYGSVTLD